MQQQRYSMRMPLVSQLVSQSQYARSGLMLQAELDALSDDPNCML